MEIKLSDHFTHSKLIKYTIPSILSMIFMSFFGVIDDGFFTSNFVGKEAFVAINIMAPIYTIVVAIASMVATGGSALVSKTLGEKKDQKANEYFSMVTIVSIIIGIAFTIVGYAVLKPFCIMLGAEGKVLEDCLIYGMIELPFIAIFMIQNTLQVFLIMAEKPNLAFGLTILSGVTNIIFDVLLIVVLKLGIVGAVCATISGSIVSAIVALFYFLRSKNCIIKFTKTKIDFKVIGKVCFNGLSELVSNMSAAVVAVLFNYQLMKFIGNDGVAAYGVIMYLGFIFSSIAYGYSAGASPIISYHYGAKNENELKSLLKKSIALLGIGSAIQLILSVFFAKPLAMIFAGYDTELLNMAVSAFRIYCISLLFISINTFASAFFTALNDGITSGKISFIRTFIMQAGTILILPMIFETNGIWIAPVIAEILAIAMVIYYFIKMRSKYNYA